MFQMQPCVGWKLRHSNTTTGKVVTCVYVGVCWGGCVWGDVIDPVIHLEIYYSKKLEEQTFDIRFFSLVRIQGIWVLLDETSTSHNIRFLTMQGHLFHLATPKISSFLTRLKNLTSKICSSNFSEQCILGKFEDSLSMKNYKCSYSTVYRSPRQLSLTDPTEWLTFAIFQNVPVFIQMIRTL